MTRKMNDDRLSPLMPTSAMMPIGSAVRQRIMIFAVSVRADTENTGMPIASRMTSASAVLRSFSSPPKKVPPSMKLGGMI